MHVQTNLAGRHREDLDAIDAKLAELGCLSLCSLTLEPLGSLSDFDGLFALLVPSRDEAWCDLIQERSGANPHHIDTNLSTVIEFWRPYCDDVIVRRGRFYFQNRVIVGTRLQSKNEQFLAWAEKIFRVIRKELAFRRDIGDTYLGKVAVGKVESGALRLF